MKKLLSIATLNMSCDAPEVSTEVDDAALMAHISSGNRNAFNTFLSRHLTAVVQFAKCYLSSQADAEDIAQETFFRVWRKSASWKPQGYSPRSWIYRIAYNLCIDEIRRRPAVDTGKESSYENDLYNEIDSLDMKIESDSELKRLVLSLKKLPERQRTAITLCAFHGLSNKEASSAMDISIDALESLLSRGRRQLRQLCNERER